MIVIDPLLSVIAASLFVLIGALVLWNATREDPEWHSTPARAVRRGAAVRVTYPMIVSSNRSEPSRRDLVIYGIVEDVLGDSIFLKDQTQITEDDLHGATVEVWRR